MLFTLETNWKTQQACLSLEIVEQFFTKEVLVLILPSPSKLLNSEKRSHSVTFESSVGGQGSLLK